MKRYNGYRDEHGNTRVTWVNLKREEKLLPERPDLGSDFIAVGGFEWGYRGAGPFRLSVALIAHVLGDAFAEGYYQHFTDFVVCRLPPAGWTLTEFEIRDKVLEIAKWAKANAG